MNENKILHDTLTKLFEADDDDDENIDDIVEFLRAVDGTDGLEDVSREN